MYRKNVIASYVHFNEMLKIFIISHHQKKLIGLNLFHVRFSEPALNFICCKLQLSDHILLSQLANTLKWPKLCNLSNVQRQKGIIVEMLIFVKLGL